MCPKFCITFFFSFLLCIATVPREIENNAYAKFEGQIRWIMGNVEVAHNQRITWAPKVLPARGFGGILPQKILKFGCSETLFVTVLRGRFLSKMFAKSIVIWVSGSGGSRGGLPLIFRPNWGPKGRKNSFGRPPPPPYLRVWMTAPPSPPAPIYPKVWIRHCQVHLSTLLGVLVYLSWKYQSRCQNWDCSYPDRMLVGFEIFEQNR